ncbi:MAG: hypothetical protein J6039_04450 [Alphaproteobacteria bacterium]|nr:hypothetical protein [Alphaproteobacteria bacterium]
MEKEVIRMHAELTKHGLVALWESGGGMTHTGNAQIIVKPDGEKPLAVYIPHKGQLSCGNHALIPVQPYWYLISTTRWRDEIEHKVYKIARISKIGDPHVELTLINKFDKGEWDTPPESFLEKAIQTAEDKCKIYHCRSAVYVRTK